RFERRISPQQTNRFCFQSIIGGLCFEPPHRALNSKVVLDKSAKIYKREKRYPEALKAVDEARSIDAKSASVHYLRAQILTEIGHHSEAETELAVVRRLKRETLDKLEQEVNGAKYHDPELAGSDDR
ncbi:MAG: hypothetical protein M3Y72_23585, partial [Acidobacteriota bacterium]|nr:hypothetical protein [Acidobacteriota bacterium]